jgi:uncharacterized membrane-anchored protein YhcB (DUF1043 family)
MIKNKSTEDYVTSKQFNQFQSSVNKEFRNIDTRFDEVRHTLDRHTAALLSIENTMKFYGDMYQMNKDSIDKLNNRVLLLENA